MDDDGENNEPNGSSCSQPVIIGGCHMNTNGSPSADFNQNETSSNGRPVTKVSP